MDISWPWHPTTSGTAGSACWLALSVKVRVDSPRLPLPAHTSDRPERFTCERIVPGVPAERRTADVRDPASHTPASVFWIVARHSGPGLAKMLAAIIPNPITR